MQIQSLWILGNRLAIFRRGFGKFVLRFENLRGQLVHAIRCRRLLEHAMGDIVERLHVKTGSLVERVGVVRIPGFQLGREAKRRVCFARGAQALNQRQAREAGKIGIPGTVEARGEIPDCLRAVSAGGSCQSQKGARVFVAAVAAHRVLEQPARLDIAAVLKGGDPLFGDRLAGGAQRPRQR